MTSIESFLDSLLSEDYSDLYERFDVHDISELEALQDLYALDSIDDLRSLPTLTESQRSYADQVARELKAMEDRYSHLAADTNPFEPGLEQYYVSPDDIFEPGLEQYYVSPDELFARPPIYIDLFETNRRLGGEGVEYKLKYIANLQDYKIAEWRQAAGQLATWIESKRGAQTHTNIKLNPANLSGASGFMESVTFTNTVEVENPTVFIAKMILQMIMDMAERVKGESATAIGVEGDEFIFTVSLTGMFGLGTKRNPQTKSMQYFPVASEAGCIFLSVEAGRAFIQDPKLYMSYRRSRKPISDAHLENAKKLASRVGSLSEWDKPQGLSMVKKLEAELGINIAVAKQEPKTTKPTWLYRGSLKFERRRRDGKTNHYFTGIFLDYIDQHFNAIIQPSSILFPGREILCTECMEGKTQIDGACLACQASVRQHVCYCGVERAMNHPPDDDYSRECPDCNRAFRSAECYEAHKTEICQRSIKCLKCSKLIRRGGRSNTVWKPELRAKALDAHVCYGYKCPCCKAQVQMDHDCTIQQTKPKPYYKDKVFAWDYESAFDGDNHIPCFIGVISDSGEEFEFSGLDMIDGVYNRAGCSSQFITWALTHKRAMFYAHNAAKYDHIHLINAFLQEGMKLAVIKNQMSWMQLSYTTNNTKLVFRDFLHHVQSRLSGLPKTLGFAEETEFLKGYFPYLFLTVDRFERIESGSELDERPELGDYGKRAVPELEGWTDDSSCPMIAFDHTTGGEKKEAIDHFYWFLKSNYPESELYSRLRTYCIQDCKVLMKAMKVYGELVDSQMGLDWKTFMTVSSLSSWYGRSLMPKNSVEYIKKVKNPNQSNIAKDWLARCANGAARHGYTLQYAGSSAGEKVVLVDGKRYHIDGYCPETKTAFSFRGCAVHGCPTCYPKRYQKFHGHTYEDLYTQEKLREATLMKSPEVRSIKSIWLHEYKDQLRALGLSNKEIQKLHETNHVHLDPRDAYCGGRTETFQLVPPSLEKGQSIEYYDIVSMYPSTMYWQFMPYGKHKTFTFKSRVRIESWAEYVGLLGKMKSFNPTVNVFLAHNGSVEREEAYGKKHIGLFKGVLLPPKKLLLPVVPKKYVCGTSYKLIYPLCDTCAKTRMEEDVTFHSECTHSDSERAMEVTLTSIELYQALKSGYQILYLDEIWHYEGCTKDLWRGFIRQFIKIKSQASKRCDRVGLKEILDIDVGDNEFNPGLRSLAKLLLNALYGKYGEKADKTINTFVGNASEYIKVMDNNEFSDQTPQRINDEFDLISYKKSIEHQDELPHVNIVLASFITAGSRLRLYQFMNLAPERLLYVDTDSCHHIFWDYEKALLKGLDWVPRTESEGLACSEFKRRLKNIKTGTVLGQWESEFDDDEIGLEFCSSGPKSYQDRTTKKILRHSKGITLNMTTTRELTPARFKEILFKYCEYYDEREGAEPHTMVTFERFTKYLGNVNGAHAGIKTYKGSKIFRWRFNKRGVVRSEGCLMTRPLGW